MFLRAFESDFKATYECTRIVFEEENETSEWDETLIVQIDPSSGRYRTKRRRTHSMGVIEDGEWAYRKIEKVTKKGQASTVFLLSNLMNVEVNARGYARLNLTDKGRELYR